MKAITSIIFIGVSVGLFFWYMEPAWAAISQTQSQASQYAEDIAQAGAATAKYNQLITSYNTFTPDNLAQLQKFLPAGIDPIHFTFALNSVAANYSSGLTSVSVGTAGPAAGANYDILPVTFTVAMTYPNFLLFLHDLEHSLPPTDVTSLSFTPPDIGSLYTFTVSVQTYYLQ